MLKAGITLLLGTFAAVLMHVAEVPYFDGRVFHILCLTASSLSLLFLLSGFAWLEYPEFRRLFSFGHVSEEIPGHEDLLHEHSYHRR